MSERDGLCPIMLILARFSKCILGTDVQDKHPPEFPTVGGFARWRICQTARPSQIQPGQPSPRHATSDQSPHHAAQSITLISPPPDDRQPAAILPCCLRHVVPAAFAALAPLADIPRLANTKSKQPTDLSQSHRSPGPPPPVDPSPAAVCHLLPNSASRCRLQSRWLPRHQGGPLPS